MTSTFSTSTRKPIAGPLHINRAHGVYSSKLRTEKANDIWGKPLGFLCTQAPFYEPKETNERAKGKQVMTRWPHTGEFFGKLTYAPDAYDDNSKRDKTRKFGFATGRPLNRDDLSSTIEVLRFRHHLQMEAKMDKNAQATLMDRARQLREAQETARRTGTLQRPPSGLAAILPVHTTAFDRERAVEPFSTRKLPAGKKYERSYGPLRPTSADIGEGCDDSALLGTPQFGVRDFVGSLCSKYAHPTVNGKMTYAQ